MSQRAAAHKSAIIIPPGGGTNINVIGDNQFIRLRGEQTGGKFALIEQVNPAGVGVPPHVHTNEDEMFHVVEGKVHFNVGGEEIVGEAGTTVYLPRGVPHAFQVGEGGARVILTLIPAGAEKMFEELATLPPGPPDLDRVRAICDPYGIILL